MKMIPSAIYPVSLLDILKVIYLYFFGRNDKFTEEFSQYTGIKNCYDVSSGRAALYLILTVIKQKNPEKRNVLVPAITCPTVVASVNKAGLKPIYYDVSSETLGTDNKSVKELINDDTLAVIASSLYGIPCDLGELKEIVAEKGAYLIEDNAHALGVYEKGILTGHFGDFSFFSFGKSKNLTTMSGGMICTENADFADPIEKLSSNIPKSNTFSSIFTFFEFVLYYLISLPFLFYLITRFKKRFSTGAHNTWFRVSRMSRMQKIIGRVLLASFSEMNEIRQKNSQVWSEKLYSLNSLGTLDLIGKTPIFLRYPVLAKNKEERASLIRFFRKQGLWAMEGIYPILGESTDKFPNAVNIEQRLMLLPVNHRINKEIIKKVCTRLKQLFNKES